MALDRTVSVKLKAEVAGYMASIRQAGAATSSFASKIGSGATKNKAHLDKLSGALGVVGVVAGAGVAAAVRSFANFDRSMSGVESATHESAENMDLLRDAALDAGAKTSFSATEAAGAIEELAKAGVSTSDVLGGALTGALDLAAAGSLDVGTAAEIAASAMTQFGLSGSDIPHVADLLAAAAGKAQGSVEDMGMALNQGGLVASTFEYSIEETTGVLAEFAAAGLTGSDAGTSLKTMLLRLANPSEEAAAAMKEFGIAAYDSGGSMVSPTELAGELSMGMGELDDATRNAALATIFGSDAIRAASVLLADGADVASGWEEAVNDDGYAAQTAALKMNNLSGDIERLKGSFETFLIGLGEGANGPLRGFVQGVEDIVNALGRLSPEQQASILKTLAFIAALALGAATAIKAITALAALQTAMTVLTGKTAAATTGLGRFNTAVSLGKLAGAAAGIIAVAYAADELMKATARADVPRIAVDKLADSMINTGNAATLSAEGIALFGANTQAFKRDAETSEQALAALVGTMADAGGTRVGDKIDRLLGAGGAAMEKLTTQTTQMDAAFAQLVQNGHADRAAEQFGVLREAALEAQFPLAKLDALFPEYSAALKNIPDVAPIVAKTTAELQEERDAFLLLNPLAMTAEEVTQEYADRQTEAATKVSEHADALDHLLENLGLLNNTAIDSTRAQLDFLDAISRTKDEIKEAGGSLDENTAKGRDNVNWMLDGIEAAETLAAAVQKKSAETKSDGDATDDANASYDRSIGKLRAAAEAAGLSKGAVDKLIAAHARVKPVVETIFNNPGLDKSITSTADFKGWLDKLPPSKKTAISAPGAEGAAAQVRAVRDYVNQLHDRAITIRTRYVSTASVQTGSAADAEARRQGLGQATGGYISGPGTGTSDSIPTWLSNGEYVINAAATSANRALLDAINRGGLATGGTATRAVGYANGGPVATRPGPTINYGNVTVTNVDELLRKQENKLRDITSMSIRGG